MGIVERLRDLDIRSGNQAADLIERLKGYVVHKRECPIVKGWGQAGNCQCGLTALIKEIEGE